MATESNEFYYISRTQNVRRLQKVSFIAHFPNEENTKPLCGKHAPHKYRRLSVKVWNDNNLIICEDCLTHAGEY
jgi:hypothetical protein